uniref:Mediator of RNA polymerase II transcription subunit 23 n=1 Tax=Romanomermis culicivorax TaxID=13658 RepID=A0A915JU19_ROMCU
MAGLEAVRDLRLDVKNRLEVVFQQLTSSNFLEMFFADMIVPPTSESEAEKRQFTIQEIMNIFRSATNEKPEMLFNNVLSWRIRSENVDLLIKDLINTLIQSQFLSLRSVCEVLLTSPDLKISNEKLWTDTLEYIDKSISKLDYKGVRDVFKLLLDHISNCPSKFSVDSRQNHLLIENMILRICDRKENLLPAYFIINEIRKQYYEPKCFPHWDVHQPQNYIIHQIILQPTFRELLSVLLSLQGFKQQVRFSMEEIFVSTILELMAEVEREGRLHRQVWSTLGSVSIFLFINNLIVFPKLIRNLQIKLSALPYRKARDDLMWFLMQCLSGLVSKIQVADDITVILDLYRVLYTGSEEFSVSESDPSCVYMMAATCVWVLVLERYKEMNADPNSSLQNLEIPPSIKTQITYL